MHSAPGPTLSQPTYWPRPLDGHLPLPVLPPLGYPSLMVAPYHTLHHLMPQPYVPVNRSPTKRARLTWSAALESSPRQEVVHGDSSDEDEGVVTGIAFADLGMSRAEGEHLGFMVVQPWVKEDLPLLSRPTQKCLSAFVLDDWEAELEEAYPS